MKYTKTAIEESRQSLLEDFKNSTGQVYGDVKIVSASGMSRKIELYLIINGDLKRISWDVARVLELLYDDRGLRVNGCGMDMIFHTLYNLVRVLGLPEDLAQHYRRI